LEFIAFLTCATSSVSQIAPFAALALSVIGLLLSLSTDFLAVTLLGMIPTLVSLWACCGFKVVQGKTPWGKMIAMGVGMVVGFFCGYMCLYEAAIHACNEVYPEHGYTGDDFYHGYDVLYRCDEATYRYQGVLGGVVWFLAILCLSHSKFETAVEAVVVSVDPIDNGETSRYTDDVKPLNTV